MDDGLLKGFKNKRQVDLAGTILKAGAGQATIGTASSALRNILGFTSRIAICERPLLLKVVSMIGL